jgi:hypothetical protein
MRKGLRAATGGGIYDLMDAQASRQDSSVQARNREEQPYPGAMSQNMPGMATGGRIARLARMVTGQRAQGRPVKKLTQDFPEMQSVIAKPSPGIKRYFARRRKEEQVRLGKANAKLRKRGEPPMTAEDIPFAGGGAVKLAANRVKAMRRFLARGPKSELPPRSARQKTAAATGAGLALVGAKAAGDVTAEHTGPGAKMNYRSMGKNAAEAPMVNPLKFKYNDPSTWPKKARGGMLLKVLKKPATAAGERWKGKLEAVDAQAPKKGPALQTPTAQRLLERRRVIMKNKNPAGYLNDHVRRDYPGADLTEQKRWSRSTRMHNQEKVERLGSKYGATRREEIVDPWGSVGLHKAHGGKLSIKAIKRLKPFRAKGKITPNDPPETMRYGGKLRARLKR